MSNTEEKKTGRPRKTNVQGATKKKELLAAAQKIITRDGVRQLTFDRIVKEANVAKGTLLYHFQTKDNLLLELVKDYVNHLDEKIQEGIDAAKDATNPVAGGFAYWYRKFYADAKTNTSFGISILTYSAKHEALLEPVRNWYEKIFERAKTAGDETADVIFAILAIEGLFYLQHLNLNTLSRAENEAVVDRIIERFKKC